MLDAKQEKRIATAPVSAQGILRRAFTGRSRKTAIKAMCLECVGFDRSAITGCTATACPLWKFRPVFGVSQAAEETEAK